MELSNTTVNTIAYQETVGHRWRIKLDQAQHRCPTVGVIPKHYACVHSTLLGVRNANKLMMGVRNGNELQHTIASQKN